MLLHIFVSNYKTINLIKLRNEKNIIYFFFRFSICDWMLYNQLYSVVGWCYLERSWFENAWSSENNQFYFKDEVSFYFAKKTKNGFQIYSKMAPEYCAIKYRPTKHCFTLRKVRLKIGKNNVVIKKKRKKTCVRL